MRITDAIIQSGAVDKLRRTAGVKDASKTDSSEKSRSKDSVAISDTGRKMSQNLEGSAVSARAEALPDVRNERINEVKDKIASGFYNSPEFMDKLADRLINDMWGDK